jgi:hypothetical protein
MARQLGTPRGRYDENSGKSFSLNKKPRYVNQEKKKPMTTEGDADWLNSTPTRAPFNDTC